MAQYDGIRVVQGPNILKEPILFIGTIIYNKSHCFNYEKVVCVRWDDGIFNYYAIGHENKYNLLVYDNTVNGKNYDGFICNNCIHKNAIVGTMWLCLQCTNIYMCSSCYMIQTTHKDHDFCRFDQPNEMGYFVGRMSKCDKYNGIVNGSKVITTAEFNEKVFGQVESINYEKKRLVIKVKTELNNIKKYRRYEELKFKDDCFSDVIIDKNHLRVLGHNPIFNHQLCQHYKSYLDKFSFEFQIKSIIEKDDEVYVDCFDALDLYDFQKGLGESNNKIEELIGRGGVVVNVQDDVVRIRFSKIEEDIPINRNLIFNKRWEDWKIIKITNDKKAIETEYKKWIEEISVKADNQRWYPSSNMYGKINNKVGVIILNDLPSELVVVRFKKYSYSFCMLIPKKLCIDLTELSDNGHVFSNYDDNLTKEENDLLELWKTNISNNDLQNFEQDVMNVESDKIKLFTKEVIYALFDYAIEIKNGDIFRILNLESTYPGIGTEFILRGLLRKTEWSSEMLEIILNNVTLNLRIKTSPGDNLLHLASKNNYSLFIEKVLCEKKYVNMVDIRNEITNFTPLHYAVSNNYVDVVRVLMHHNCDIYAKTKNGQTALHIALEQYYLDVLLVILELQSGDLELEEVDSEHNNILHLASLMPNDKDILKRWSLMIENDEDNLFKKRIISFQKFQKIFEKKITFDVKDAPFIILSALILEKGKNSSRIWNHNNNKKNCTPANIFNDSLRQIVDQNIVNKDRLLRLFKRYLHDNKDIRMCDFCKADFATVKYQPCDHILHCFYCCFMLLQCPQCNEIITSKTIDGEIIKDFESWSDFAKDIFDQKYPENMNDWLKITQTLLLERQCQCCKEQSISLMIIKCGHCICAKCKDKIVKCPFCNQDEMEVMEIKISHKS